MHLPVRAPLPGDRPADLREANFFAAQLGHADLRDADLRRANLQLADLSGAQLRGARLTWADLTCATLTGADLRNADLSEADLAGADLRDADLRGALLTGANLAHAHVSGARGLPTTLHFHAGRVPGPTVAGHADEPQAGLDAFARARDLHAQGRLAHAERAYRLARAWQPDSDIVPYALACLALDCDDPQTARAWLQATLAVAPDAERAQLEFAVLDAALAEPPVVDAARRAQVGDTALTAWLERRQTQSPPLPPPQRTGHATVAEAIGAGDLPLAERLVHRLAEDEPLAALWRLLLPKLHATAQAIDALLQTRQPPLPAPTALSWESLGAHATTARLTTPDGTFWAQRAAGALRSESGLRYTHQLQELLAARGLCVPRWLPDADGRPWLGFDGDWLVVAADVGGVPLQPTVAHAALAGTTLARVHTLGLDVAARPREGLRAGLTLLQAPHPGARWLAELQAVPALEPRLAALPLHARIAPLLELTARRLRDALPLCPQGLCHGDFSLKNLRLLPDGALAVLDWDLADQQPLVWDLARAMDLLAVRGPGRAADPPLLDRPRLRALLDAYQAVRPLNPAERAALPLLVATSRLDLDVGLLTLLAPLDPDVLDALLPRVHARLTYAAAGAPELAALL